MPLDGVRGLAVLLVLCFHTSVALRWTPSGIIERLVNTIVCRGEFGVDLFFVLSGFLITSILLAQKQDAFYFQRFYYRRVLRIIPLYWFFLFFVLHILPLFVTVPMLSAVRTYEPYYWLFWSNHLIYGPYSVFVMHTWSLAVEEQFYLVWPAVVKYVPGKFFVRLCLGMIVVAVSARAVLCYNIDHLAHWFAVCNLHTLGAGALLASVYRSKPELLSARLGWVLVALGPSAVGLSSLLYALHVSAAVGIDVVGSSASVGFCLLWTGLMILALSAQASIAQSFLKLPILRLFGKYSYSIYLFHFPILYFLNLQLLPVLRQHLHQQLAVLFLQTGILAGASLLVGWLTFTFLEHPFLSLKDRLFDAKGPASGTAS